MSHTIGPLISVNRRIGPDSLVAPTSPNVWLDTGLAPTVSVPEHGSVKFVILHFNNAQFSPSSRMEIELGNGQTDVFDDSSGRDFFTRPIKVTDGGNVEIRYIDSGSGTGGVTLFEYGQGEEFDSGVVLDASGNNTQPEASKTNTDVFMHDLNYRDPIFETRGGSTRWENVACISPAGNPLINAAKSIGIIVMIHGDHVSTCSGTLIQPNLFLTAGHCMGDAADLEVRSGSVCFDFATTCTNERPTGYNPQFFKIKNRISFAWGGGYDYALVELDVPAGGTGVSPANIRLDLPSVSERVFAIHHPNGTIKKISDASILPRITSITGSDSQFLNLANVDLKGGSSGSGLFDINGNYLGVLPWPSRANAINSILRRIADPPVSGTLREVMIVLDRSGSMSGTGSSGRSKLEEAKDAASLFVQLIRNGSGDKIGMVSFSTSASSPLDYSIREVTTANKNSLVGTSPFSGGAVGGLVADGLTSIGSGLETALTQFGSNDSDKVILLLTDGLQNTSPLIENIESSLGATRLCIIGFGNESNLDGSLLTRLAWENSGSYSVAGNNMELAKFFAICFGEIFEDGSSFDPFYLLPAEKEVADPVNLSICEEDSISVVLGWDKADRSLGLRLISPNGNIIKTGMPNVQSEFGKTWAFLRVDLPFNTEREGEWKIEVFRPQGPIVFFANGNTNSNINYFLNVVAKGGPRLKNLTRRNRVYTGDPLIPQLLLQYPNDTVPSNIDMKITLSVPNESIGNLVVKAGLKEGSTIAGDVIGARQQVLRNIASEQGGTLINFTEQEYELSEYFEDVDTLEPRGIFGENLKDLTLHEGHYSFKANATYGSGCKGSREMTWTVFVNVGIDPENSPVTTTVIDVLPSGKQKVRIVFTPKDKYGNFLGPGKQTDFELFPAVGNELVDGLTDNGDGSYSQDVVPDDASVVPGISIVQDGRPPIILCPETNRDENSKNTKYYLWIFLILLLILLIICLLKCS